MPTESRQKRVLLLSFVGSISCCGLVGVYCLLTGRFGQTEARILGTTALVGAASILGLCAAIPWERRLWHPIGPLAMTAVAIALAMTLIAIWTELSPWKYEPYFDTMFILCVLGVALPHMGLLSLARLQREYQWVRRETILAIILLGLQIDASILANIDNGQWYRVMGILGIAVVCGSIAVPVLHRVSTMRSREHVRTVELMLSLTCPRCDTIQTLPAGRSRCSHCGLRFNIDIEEDQCKHCGYALYQLTSPVCPECGTPIKDAAP